MNRSRRTRDRGPGRRRPSRDELLARSDEQLVEFVLDGHELAFDVLFDRHVADSLWYAREVLGSWGEAEEAVRHSFAAAHAYLATRGRETEFWPWLQTILGNYCLSMLQARTPGPEPSEDEGAVVDLGEWRLRRKLSGMALPFAPGAGLREAVMAVCGVGGGAAAAGAPLMGGTLAKLAVVAVLAAGGAGVVGDAAHERAEPGDAGVRSSASGERASDRSGHARGIEPVSRLAGGGRRSPTATVRKLDDERSPTRERLALRGRAPAAPAPGDPAATPPGEAAPAAELAPAPTPPDAAVPVRVADSVVQHVANVVTTRAPAVGGSPQTPPPGSLDLSKIGDDLGVSASRSPVDVRALLSRGMAVLPK